MRLLFRSVALSAALLGLAATGPEKVSTSAAKQALSIADGHALQGNIRPALEALSGITEADLAEPAAGQRRCILARFGDGGVDPAVAALPPSAGRALALYRFYWRSSLLEPAGRDAAEERLRLSLASWLELPPMSEMSEIETRLAERLQAENIHALTGRTAPLRELMLWRGEKLDEREVALPEGPRRTRVVLLDDFLSLGWSAYATCDRRYTGGWVRPDGIYAVVPGWGDLGGEAFLVSFLGHEAQHFADQESYGELPSWELEYRAKLAELAMADKILPNLIQSFSHNQSEDTAIPHSYANRRVLAAVQAELGGLIEGAAPAAIKAAALAALRTDSARRTRRSG